MRSANIMHKFMWHPEDKLYSIILKGRLGEVVPPRADAGWTKQMRGVVDEFRQGATEFADEEIESIVDEAVNVVRKAG